MAPKTPTIQKQIADVVQQCLTRDIEEEVRQALSAAISDIRLRDTVHSALQNVARREAEKLLRTKEFRDKFLERVRKELDLSLKQAAETVVRINWKKRHYTDDD